MKIPRLLTATITIAALSCVSRKDEPTMFRLVTSERSGIVFNNSISENDTINPFDVTNMYNGAGVGVADFNNDGLTDIFFAGNQVACQLYLNKGNLQFEDVTSVANVSGNGKWCRGVSVIDINNDGWQDLYISATTYSGTEQRKNLLYVNQGKNEKNIPVFSEMASDYGLDDDSHSAMSNFFDYDNDGDLDVYITVNEIVEGTNPSVYRKPITDGSWPSTGRLYRNDWNDSLAHAFFTDVSSEAGTTIEGYGHSTTIADFNLDGWKDIFVANDFLSNDILYINNRNGTFTNKAANYFKHTSANGMGADVIDINNDGLADVIEMDMDPEDNYRKKVLMSGYNYFNYQNNDLYGYQYQYVRNSLQLNQGRRPDNDTIGEPIFSEIGFYTGIASTDWSWAPLVQDFDNDGWRDLIVTNGFPKDLTDHDFIAFREKSFANKSKREVLDAIPEVKIKNYAYRNQGHLRFENVTDYWGLKEVSFSNGAVYTDLDNDGDLDVVMSNINDKAFVYENLVREQKNTDAQFLEVTLSGDSLNRHGLGTWLTVYYHDRKQVIEHTPYRGFLSSVHSRLHFGLGNVAKIDSLVVIWPDYRKQTLLNVEAGQTLDLQHKNAQSFHDWSRAIQANPLFADVTKELGIGYVHAETDFIDFNIQKLIPHKLSEYGPAIATGDVNGDGLDDIVIGNSMGQLPTVLVQQPSAQFFQRPLVKNLPKAEWETTGIVLFDADSDGDLDIYMAAGSNEAEPESEAYQDRLLVNDGKGNFTIDESAIPLNHTSKSCVKIADFDKDGDPDLFVGGRCDPWNYPNPVTSTLLRNDSRDGKPRFTDVTSTSTKGLTKIGMVCDAQWSDFDNDGWTDLVIVGEWMSIRFFKNNKGALVDVTANSGVQNLSGWWTNIAAADFDKDGDTDFIAGNVGENSFYKATPDQPITVYAKDFYNQGTLQCIVTTFLPEKAGGRMREYTAHNRDDVVEQLPFIKKRFLTYSTFAKAPFDSLFTKEELKNAMSFKANFLSSVFVRNHGNGKFGLEKLPIVAQLSTVNGMVVDDFDKDGNLDVCMNTNDFGTDPGNGRYDALNGLVLKGDGKGTFSPLTIAQSGIYIPGSGKGIAKLKAADGSMLLVAGQNRGPVKVFRLR